MNSKISNREIVAIGLMLFALFFGAGNLIFPPALGQASGTSLWPAIIGFLLTGVGLPLLGVLAIGVSGHDDVQSLANKINPTFSLFLRLYYIYPLDHSLRFHVQRRFHMKSELLHFYLK